MTEGESALLAEVRAIRHLLEAASGPAYTTRTHIPPDLWPVYACGHQHRSREDAAACPDRPRYGSTTIEEQTR